MIVNRVWHHLFGRGLVSSVDNFGVKGDVPSHPELLDYLAERFAANGWSIKRLVRALVLSHAYRLSSEVNDDNQAVDPLNRFVWRHSPRRLTAEELRDTALVAAGNLDGARAEGSAAQELRVVELRNNGPEARKLNQVADASRQRSVYLTLLRGITPRPLEVFDFAEQGMVTGSRDATTVATQALYLLNDPFVRKQSLVLAERLLAADNRDDVERLQLAYRLALGRPATGGEIERGLRYVTEYATLVEQAPVLAQPSLPAVTQVAEVPAPAEGNGNAAAPAEQPAKKKPPVNPDEMEQTDEPQAEQAIEASSPRAAAWASFCQALVGSAEFRFLR